MTDATPVDEDMMALGRGEIEVEEFLERRKMREFRQLLMDLMGVYPSAMGNKVDVGVYSVGSVLWTEDNASAEGVADEVKWMKGKLADDLIAGLKKHKELGLPDEEIIRNIMGKSND